MEIFPKVYQPKSESVAMIANHATQMESALKEDMTYPRVNLDNHYHTVYNMNPSANLFQELSTHKIRIGGRHQYPIATILFRSYSKHKGMANTSPIIGISHENGQWAMNGPYAGLLEAVARKAKASPTRAPTQ